MKDSFHVYTLLCLVILGDFLLSYWPHVHDDPSVPHLRRAYRCVPIDGSV